MVSASKYFLETSFKENTVGNRKAKIILLSALERQGAGGVLPTEGERQRRSFYVHRTQGTEKC